MKIDRYLWNTSRTVAAGLGFSLVWLVLAGSMLNAQEVRQTPPAATAEASITLPPTAAVENQSTQGAVEMIERVIDSLAQGFAFDAKVRQRVWTNGREIVGVGTYEQAGKGTGQFNLQMTMHDGDGKHTIHQISDGRLAWTRSEIAGAVVLKRVDVGRLAEWIQPQQTPGQTPARLRVGAWTELLDTIARDYILRVAAGRLETQAVWIISGTLRSSVRQQVLTQSGRKDWPTLYPSQVKIAIAATAMDDTGFGEGIPVRIEFWSDPESYAATPAVNAPAVPPATGPNDEPIETRFQAKESRLITLIELYSLRAIDPPPVARFRFENQDAEVNFVNETDRYLERYGVKLTELDRRRLRR